MTNTKISNVQFMQLDISPNAVYKCKEMNDVFPSSESMLAVTKIGRASFDLRLLSKEPLAEEVVVTEESFQDFNKDRDYPVDSFVIAGFSAMVAGEPIAFKMVFVGYPIYFNGKHSFAVTAYTDRNGLTTNIVKAFEPAANLKGMSLSDWAKASFRLYPCFVNSKTISLMLGETLPQDHNPKALLAEVAGKMLKETIDQLDASIKDLSDI